VWSVSAEVGINSLRSHSTVGKVFVDALGSEGWWFYGWGIWNPAREPTTDDPPPLKWSDLRYVFDIKEDRNGKEAIQA
jgi:hypothetical protein